MSSMLIYIYGFHSSPLSTKSQQLKAWCQKNRPDIEYCCPLLSPYPKETLLVLQQLIAKHQDKKIGLVGSSLGGFFATWLSQQLDLPAVVVNPAVFPSTLLLAFLGTQRHPYTGEVYQFTEKHMQELKALELASLPYPKKLWLMQQQGDEVLDYRDAVIKYHRCLQSIEAGGNHLFVGFERYCQQIVDFLAL